jgi:hypothetical protein
LGDPVGCEALFCGRAVGLVLGEVAEEEIWEIGRRRGEEEKKRRRREEQEKNKRSDRLVFEMKYGCSDIVFIDIE